MNKKLEIQYVENILYLFFINKVNANKYTFLLYKKSINSIIDVADNAYELVCRNYIFYFIERGCRRHPYLAEEYRQISSSQSLWHESALDIILSFENLSN